MGKTALATTWLTNLDAPRADVCLVATLRPDPEQPVTVHEILDEWLRTLGVAPEHIPPSLPQRSTAFQERTMNRAVAVLVDNATNAADVRALIPGGNSSTIVATSIRRLGDLVLDGFRLHLLPELPADAAVDLLTAYLPPSVLPDPQPGLDELAGRCGGHPLTLCVAAAYLSMHRTTTPADLAATLARRSADTLTVGGRSLKDLLTMVYDDLPPLAQQLYRLLPDHPGPDVAIDVLATALDELDLTVDDAMHQLFHAHLVTETGPGRYALDNSVRPHAHRLRLQIDGSALRDEQLRRLITWYADRAAGAANTIKNSACRYTRVFTDHRRADSHLHPSAGRAQDWFGRERRNVMAAQTAAAEHGLDDLVVELAEAVWDPLRTGYHLDDIVTSQTRAITAARRVNPALAAVITARAAFALTSLGDDHAVAIATADDAVQLAHSADDSWARAMALSTRARALTAAGRIAEAIIDLDAALVLDRQRGDQRSIALRLRRLGQAHLALGASNRAVALLQQSVDAMDAAGDRAGHARSLTYLAQGHLAAGDPSHAVNAIRPANSYFERSRSIRHLVEARLILARAYQRLGDLEAAHDLCGELLRLLDDGPGSHADACRTEVETLKADLR
ncbi:hypothetical protein [Amycolatopsis kentuckyensis]|uniref:hypothetical protein n=1 Tax=Amycolatopsis kentuckyensis TaxID=218823 RepID=UPI00356908DB